MTEMTRNYFHNKPPAYLTVAARKDADRELVKHFKALCAARGISVQQGVLQACRNQLSEFYR